MRNFFLSLLLLGAITPLAAQSNTATVLGTVKDASAAVLPGVSVRVTNTQTGQVRETITDNEGNYLVPLLPVGEYELVFELPGFRKRILSGLTLQIEQRARIDTTLEVGEVTEAVTVEGEAPLLKSVSSEIGEVIEHRRVVDLPLNGRQFVQLALLTPAANTGLVGSVGASMQQTGPKLSVKGGREYDNNFTLDGVAVQDHFFNTLSISPSVDAIQEFKVEASNFAADKGTRSGAQINLVIRSGTNDFHGSLFEFLRNSALDARNFFDLPRQVQRARSLPEIPPFKQNQFGFTVGGPIVRDRSFFFGNYEGLRIRQSITRTFSVPTAELRSGNFSSVPQPIIDPETGQAFLGNIIPQAKINAISRALLEFFPLPNIPGSSVQNFVGNPTYTNDADQFNVRMDHRFSESDTLFGRFSYSDIEALNPFGGAQFGAANVTPPLPGFGMITQTRGRNLAVGQTHIFSATFISEFRFGLNWVEGGQLHENQGKDVNTRVGIQGTTSDPALTGIPNVTTGIFSGFGDQTTVLNNTDLTYQFIEGLTLVRGNHQFKFGGELTRIHFNPNLDVFSRGSFIFTPRYTVAPGPGGASPLAAFADFLLGYPTTASVGLGDARVFGRSWNIHGYFQDDWKVSPRLTVNLGIRYDYFGPVTSTKLRGATFDVSRCGPLAPNNCPNGVFVIPSKDGKTATEAFAAGVLERMPFPVIGSEQAGFPRSLFDRDLNNFAPRTGFAYSVAGKTVIRAGYGVYFNLSQFNQIGQESFNPPFFDIRSLTNDATPATATSAPKPRNTIQNILLDRGSGTLRIGPNDRNFPAAYAQQWSLNIEHSITPNMLFEIAYLGTKSTKLQENHSLNDAVAGPGNGRQGAWIPQLGPISFKTVGGASNYHALVLRAEKRLSHGLAFVSSYTWSKSLDRSSATESFLGGGGFQNVRFMRRNYGPSTFDIRHNSITSFTYDAPLGPGKTYLNQGVAGRILGGWQIGGILNFRTGQPNTVSLFQNRSNAGGSRPNTIGNPNLPSSQRSPERYYNRAAFELQPQFDHGNAGRGTMVSPGVNNIDFSMLKNIALWENHNLQFRAEFFNVFNHANLGFPVLEWDSPAFGRIFSAGNSRQIQFGLKYIF